MKATGIVRRIDDLGRVVIPKEIRRTLRIHEGDPLEIFTEKDGEVIFRKYSPVGEIGGIAADCAEALNKAAGISVIICDRDTVVASSGLPGREYNERSVTDEFRTVCGARGGYSHTEKKLYPVAGCGRFVSCASPIVCDGDVTGVVAVLSGDDGKTDRADVRLASAAAGFIASQLN